MMGATTDANEIDRLVCSEEADDIKKEEEDDV